MSKFKVLVVPSDHTGVGKFRSIDPHVRLNNLFPKEFKVDINHQPQLSEGFLTKYDLIHCHRTLGDYEQAPEWFDKLQQWGIPTILDLDDYWAPGPEHPAHILIKQHKLAEKVVANLRSVQYVTTTTPIFADRLKETNRNVFILPNAVDPTQKQFQANPEPSDKIRIGWLGGSSHYHDLLQLAGMASNLNDDFDNLQFVVCGFDIRGQVTFIDPQTGEQKNRPIKPSETVWVQYEQFFSNSNDLSGGYRDYLKEFKNKPFPGEENEKYRRVWTKPVTTYASNYNLFDISLAPLKPNTFNLMKSQLKVIEAGFHKKALVAQDVAPYQLDVVNGKNGILIPYKKTSKPWYKAVKRLIKEPNQIKDLGEALYETVKDTYHLDKVTKDRAELYRSLIKK